MSGTTTTPAGVPISALPVAGTVAPTDILLVLVQDPVTKLASPMQISLQSLISSLATSNLVPTMDSGGDLSAPGTMFTLGGAIVLSTDGAGQTRICFGTSLRIQGNVPTADPHQAGVVWTNNGALMLSAG